jgi:hypothetical protein
MLTLYSLQLRGKFVLVIFKISVFREEERETKKNQLFNAVDESHPFYSVNHMKHNNTLYEQNAEL